MTKMDPSNLGNRDHILSEINRLQKERSGYDEQLARANKEIEKREEVQKTLQKAFNELRRHLSEAGENTNKAKDRRWDLIDSDKRNKADLEKYRRELARLDDLAINEQAYLEQVEALRNSCLEATWRKENRDDGLGALEHQIEGAIHLASVKSGLLGDKRGLGKTLTSLVWMDLLEAKKIIALVPSDTMDNFIREIKMWAPHRNPIKLGKMPKAQRDFVFQSIQALPQFILVLNYEAWRKDATLVEDLVALKADTFIEDEAHRAKTLTTVTCRGATAIRFGANQCNNCGSDAINVDYFQKEIFFAGQEHSCAVCGHTGRITEFTSIKNVMPMTGTPILNKPQEIFPHLRMVDVKNFPYEDKFLVDFCEQDGAGRWRWKPGAIDRLTKLIGPKYLARDRKSAGVVIPPSEIIMHTVSLKDVEENYPQQYKAYMQARIAAQIVFDPDKQIVMPMMYEIVTLLRLRQILTWPAGIHYEIKDYKSDPPEVIYSADLDVEESIKVDKAEELLRELIEEGERVVVFSQLKPPLVELQRRLGDRVALYTGDTNDYQRNLIQLDFDVKTSPTARGEKPRWDAVLCTYKTAGEGLNLNDASQMIIIDEEWNPGKRDQSYGRIDRLGQKKETQIHLIRVEKSVDDWLAALIDMKEKMIAGFEESVELTQLAWDAFRNGEM